MFLVVIKRKQIQEALNQQTHPHFKAYAEQQHPNNISAVSELFNNKNLNVTLSFKIRIRAR